MLKIYFSKYFDDYIFVIGGQPYIYENTKDLLTDVMLYYIDNNHLKNSRMHKRKEDKEVEFICTVKD